MTQPLELLDGLGAIALFLGWSRKRVRRFVRDGLLPVKVLGTGRGRRYLARPEQLRDALSAPGVG